MPYCPKKPEPDKEKDAYGIDIAEFLRRKREPPKCRICGVSFWGLELYIYKYCVVCWMKLIADGLKKKK